MTSSILGLAATALGFMASFLYGIVLTPYLVRHLDIDVYGLLPLSFALVAYFGILTQTIGASLNARLVARHRDADAFNGVFTISLSLSSCVGVVVFLVGWIASPHLSRVVDIPAGHESDAQAIFLATLAALAMSLIVVPFHGVLFAASKIYLIASIQALQTVARAILIVLLFGLFSASMEAVAAAIVASAALSMLSSAIAAFAARGSLAFRPSGFRLSIVVELLQTSGGVLMTQIGTLLIFNVDLLLVNHLAGASESARYAAAAQWAVALRGLAVGVAGVFSPAIMKLYSGRQNRDALATFVRSVSTYCGASIALPAGFLAGAGPELLGVWIGPDVASCWQVTALSSLGAVICATAVPAWTVSLAANKVYLPGVVTLSTGGLVIVGGLLSSLLPVPLAAGVAGAVVVAQLCQTMFFTMPYAARNATQRPTAFLSPVARSFGYFVISASLSLVAVGLARPENFLQLTACGVLIAPFYCVIVFLSMPRDDRGRMTRNAGAVAEKLRAVLT